MATTNIPYCDIPYWQVTTATSDGVTDNYYYVNDGTGGPYTRHYESGWTPTELDRIDKTLDIAKAVTKKDLKMVKDEVKKYMKDQMVKDAKKIAGKLFNDIENLKKEKTQLKKDVTELKKQVEQVKKDIQAELEAIEKMMERKAKEIFKFAELDFSR